MNIRTECGDSIYCLPDCARCKISGISPEHMDSCPLYRYDPLRGETCIPESCEEYTEDWDSYDCSEIADDL